MLEEYFTVHLNNMKTTSYNKLDKRTQCEHREKHILPFHVAVHS